MKHVTIEDIAAYLVPSSSSTQTEVQENTIRVRSKGKVVRQLTILSDVTAKLNQSLGEEEACLCVVVDETPQKKLYRCCFFRPNDDLSVITSQFIEEKAKFSVGRSIVGIENGIRYHPNLRSLSQTEKEQFSRISHVFLRELIQLPAFRLLYVTGQINMEGNEFC